MLLDHPAVKLKRSFAAAFAPALTDPTLATPDDVIGPRGKAAARRYNVYRNNVMVSLIDALAAVYPAVQRITGVDFFRAMARFHVRAAPPASPLLLEYGRDFPAFIEGYVVDGHVPVEAIRKLLAERPAIAGITLPGMPMGSPGMAGEKTGPFTVYAVAKDGTAPTVYVTL